MTRCIHCTRCVRFTAEIAGTYELGGMGRGEHLQIGTYDGKPLTTELSGNVIDVCPVGALTNKVFRFRARAWELIARESLGYHDALGSQPVPARAPRRSAAHRAARQRGGQRVLAVRPRPLQPPGPVFRRPRERAAAKSRRRRVARGQLGRGAGAAARCCATTPRRPGRAGASGDLERGGRAAGALAAAWAPATSTTASPSGRPVRRRGGRAVRACRSPTIERPTCGHGRQQPAPRGAAAAPARAQGLPRGREGARRQPGRFRVRLRHRRQGTCRAVGFRARAARAGKRPARGDRRWTGRAVVDRRRQPNAVVLASAASNASVPRARARAGATGAALCRIPQGANAVGLARHGVLPASRDAAAMLAAAARATCSTASSRAWISPTRPQALPRWAAPRSWPSAAYACESTLAVADVILPIGLLPEIDATLTNLDGHDQFGVAGGKLPGEARPGWRVLRALGGELGWTVSISSTCRAARRLVLGAGGGTGVRGRRRMSPARAAAASLARRSTAAMRSCAAPRRCRRIR
jgi:NADH-quinone oxidoreductase subunit G